MSVLVDTHCHLDAPEFDDDRGEVWDRAKWNGMDDQLVTDVREIRSRVSHAG